MPSRPSAVTLAVSLLMAGAFLALDPWGWQAFGPAKWLVTTVTAWTAMAIVLRDGLAVHRVSLLAWVGFLVWAAVTSVNAVDPLSAWLGTPDRRLGWFAVATMGAAFVAGQALVGADQRRLLARVGVVTLLVMGGYGLLEAVGAAPVQVALASGRIGSTFGSPAYLAAAVLLTLPVAVAVAVPSTESRTWRLAGGAAAVAGLALLGGSGTRAATVGLAAAVAVTGPRWLPLVRRHAVPAALLLCLAIAGLVWSPLGTRLVDSPAGGRLDEWTVATRALGAYPIAGTGLEGYRLVFPTVVDDGYVRAYGRSTVTDRAHSAPLDLGVGVGVAGIVAWVVAAGWLTTRAHRAALTGDAITAGMAAGVVGYLAQELLLFPTVEVSVAAWAVAGVVVAAGNGQRRPVRTSLGAAIAALVAVAGLLAGVADLAADRGAGQALATGAAAPVERSIRLRPDSFRYPLVAAEVARNNGNLEAASALLDRALRLSPRDPALALARGRIVTERALTNGQELDAAAAALAGLVAGDPHHPALRSWHGHLLAAAGRVAEAERAWLAAEYLAPSDPAPSLDLARLYAATGQIEAGRETLARAAARGAAPADLASLEELLADEGGGR